MKKLNLFSRNKHHLFNHGLLPGLNATDSVYEAAIANLTEETSKTIGIMHCSLEEQLEAVSYILNSILKPFSITKNKLM